MRHFSPVYQPELFPFLQSDRIVNVSSVPQRSPFRYPGGKTWLIPYIRQWLTHFKKRPSCLIEPFAGGATVGLTAGFEGLAERVILVELDQQVAAVWQTILGGEAEWLVERILNFHLTIENVILSLSRVDHADLRERAFCTLLKNRTYHGGILAPGASLIKNGENGKGIASRWYPDTLARRIMAIDKIKDRFEFICGDGVEILKNYANEKNIVFFIDPPYTIGGGNNKRAGKRLYAHNEVDHDQLFKIAHQCTGQVLMTYDDNFDTKTLADRYNFSTKNISMKNTHHSKLSELIISKNLEWCAPPITPAHRPAPFPVPDH
ncbi:MAG: DNA adenine methylase [Magnetococcales bacterium]|nr:DNA adenine methylase [Magnetococcales bacterium]MBF0115026.1 DNA adenine methylase [Magnetococcales bacterium]